MQPLIKQLEALLPDVVFTLGTRFYWSPKTREVFYSDTDSDDTNAIWALLHETSHALLGHRSYRNDFELIEIEIAAWEKAKGLAQQLQLPKIEEDHIQDCLDTYRDWLHKRCVCPHCSSRSFQKDARHYQCHNCHSVWKVTASRFCRTYRLSGTSPPKLSHI